MIDQKTSFPKKALLALSLTVALNTQAMAECVTPTSPIIPDGNVASQDQLVAAQKAIKGFQEKLVEYRDCLDLLIKEVPEVAEESNESIQKRAALTAAFDASVESEKATAEEFNLAVRAFKER